MEVGKKITWPRGAHAVSGSGGMSSYLKNHEYAIGYLDMGHGTASKLTEIKLKNKAGSILSTSEANIGAAAAEAIASGVIPATGDKDFSAVSLFDMAGVDTWPIVMLTYFYLRQDMQSLDPDTAAMVLALVKYTINEGQSVLTEFGFSKIPEELKTINEASLNSVKKPADYEAYVFEGKTAMAIAGADDHVISLKRQSFADYERGQIKGDIEDLTTSLHALKKTVNSMDTSVTTLHGAGTTNPSKAFWKFLDLFQKSARFPTHLTYRAVGSSNGQKEMVGADNGNKPHNAWGAGDIPMSKSRYEAARAAGNQPVHIPIAAGAIAIFYNLKGIIGENENVDMDACTLAGVFSGKILYWDHEDIKKQNPSIKDKLPHDRIQVVHRIKGSSSTSGVTEYLESKCPAVWKLNSGSTITWPVDTHGRAGSGG